MKPDVSVSTKEIYEGLDVDEVKERPDIIGIIKAINDNDLEAISAKLCNVMENVTIKKYPIISDIKQGLLKHCALGSLMSGSGPSVFGIFDVTDKAQKAYNNMKSIYAETFLLNTVDLD